MRKKYSPALKLLRLMILPLLLLGLNTSVSAKEQSMDTGSLTVMLTDAADGRSKQGVTLAVLQVGTFEDGKKVLSKDLADTGIDLNDLRETNQAEEAAAELETKVRSLQLTDSDEVYTAKTDASGTAVFQELPAGIYLVYAADIAGFERIIPALVSIPSADQADLAVWNVRIEPKHTSLPTLMIKKTDSADRKPVLNKDFTFSGFSDADCKEKISEVKGNIKTGTADFVLTYGTIYIQESQAPEGYILSRQIVKAEYRLDNTLWIDGVQVFPDEDNCIEYDYLNTKKLTSSAGSNTAYRTGQLPLLVMALLLAGTGIIALILQKRKTDKTESR